MTIGHIVRLHDQETEGVEIVAQMVHPATLVRAVLPEPERALVMADLVILVASVALAALEELAVAQEPVEHPELAQPAATLATAGLAT